MLRPKRKIVISVHGIRTRGAWQKELASVISGNGWTYFPLDYGYFNIFQFANPSARKKKIAWFVEEYTAIIKRYPGIIPSVVAHSNGSYIVANALQQFDYIKLDKLILCGSIVRPDFNWNTIFDRGQLTALRNEVGTKDRWARYVNCLAWFDTGPSGQKGFDKDLLKENKERLAEASFDHGTHDSFQRILHYENYWLKFLETSVPYESGTESPEDFEEVVSAQDAARWSATTYFCQYLSRVREAIVNGEVSDAKTKSKVNAQVLWVIIPSAPAEADRTSIKSFFDQHQLKIAQAYEKDPRSVHCKGGHILYDIPTTLNSLLCLEKRTDAELLEAVNEFSKQLNKLIERHRWEQWIKIQRLSSLPTTLT